MAHPTRIFHKPEQLLKAWEEYKEWLQIESEKWPKVQYVGRDGKRVMDYPKLPYTYEGFKRFCFENYGDVSNYFENSQGYYNDFKEVCSRIKEWIREDQITGGLLGNYNPSITQRLNGLAENSNVSISTEQPLFPDSDSTESDE